tara:strand:+ start:78 stop:371 length:294 start_codon:yes stop_codon:yes gene_type:complete
MNHDEQVERIMTDADYEELARFRRRDLIESAAGQKFITSKWLESEFPTGVIATAQGISMYPAVSGTCVLRRNGSEFRLRLKTRGQLINLIEALGGEK